MNTAATPRRGPDQAPAATTAVPESPESQPEEPDRPSDAERGEWMVNLTTGRIFRRIRR